MARQRERLNAAEAREAIRLLFGRYNGPATLQGANEAATRLLIIDEVLQVVGWDKGEFCPETHTGTGDFTDYLLTANGDPWLVVETKRSGAAFDLPASSGPGANSSIEPLSKLFGRAGKSFQEAAKQATRYCNDHAVPLGCVTNGSQWVFFRGLSRDRQPWRSGCALVFRSADDLCSRFDEFWSALSREAAGTARVLRALDAAAHHVSGPGERPIDSLNVYRPRLEPEADAYLRAASDALLGELYGDGSDTLLERCYIEPSTEGDFERSLRRLLDDSKSQVEGDSVDEGDTDAFVNALHRTHELGGGATSSRQPIVVAGHVGAGKTTFIRRAFARLRENADAFFAVVDLEGHGTGGSIDSRQEQNEVSDIVLAKLGRAAQTALKNSGAKSDVIERADADARATLEALFAQELKRERSLAGDLRTRQPDTWAQREYDVLSAARKDSFSTLRRFIKYLRHSFTVKGKTWPVVIVLDNVDTSTDEYQSLMFGFAQQVAREGALVVLCLREDTYARGRDPGGFLTSSALQFVFHVRSPALDKVVRARVNFARRSVESSAVPPRLRSVASNSGQMQDFLSAIEQVLLVQKSEAMEILAGLAGHNIRDGLSLVRSVVMGDAACGRRRQSSADYALECLFAARNITKTTSALQLSNLFEASPAERPAHALRLRLLSYYVWAREIPARTVSERTETVISRFAALGYPSGDVELALRELLRSRALMPSDRGEALRANDIDVLPLRMTLTASGFVHITRFPTLSNYQAAMALTTRWYSADDLKTFVEQACASAGSSGLTVADIAASPALKTFTAYLFRSWAVEAQGLATSVMERCEWAREVEARAGLVGPVGSARAAPMSEEAATRARSRKPRSERQLQIYGASTPGPVSMRPLPVDFEHEGSKWLPRILWALEYARKAGLPPQSSADLARILNEFGEQRVYANNVARAFREYKKDVVHQEYWEKHGKRFHITAAGSASLDAALSRLEHGTES